MTPPGPRGRPHPASRHAKGRTTVSYAPSRSAPRAHAVGSHPTLPHEQGVPDERADVEQRVRHHEWPDPAPTPVQVDEDNAHRHVADEPADALIEVVRAAQHRARHQGSPRRPAQLSEPAQQVPDDDDLLQYGVLHRREDQYRELPPDVGQRLGHHREVGAERAGPEIEGDPRTADHGRDEGTPPEVRPRPRTVEADHAHALALAHQQVRDERDRHQSGRDTEELPGQIEPRAPRCGRGVERGRLILQAPWFGDRSDKADQGGHSARTERQRQDEQRLIPENPSCQPRFGKRIGHRPRLHLHSRLQLSNRASSPSSPR